MHENREVSCTSCPLQQDRSVKAINHNADVNVQEKSDCTVVARSRKTRIHRSLMWPARKHRLVMERPGREKRSFSKRLSGIPFHSPLWRCA